MLAQKVSGQRGHLPGQGLQEKEQVQRGEDEHQPALDGMIQLRCTEGYISAGLGCIYFKFLVRN